MSSRLPTFKWLRREKVTPRSYALVGHLGLPEDELKAVREVRPSLLQLLPWLETGWLVGYVVFTRKGWDKPSDGRFDAEVEALRASYELAPGVPMSYGPFIVGPGDPVDPVMRDIVEAFPELRKVTYAVAGTDTAWTPRYRLTAEDVFNEVHEAAELIGGRLQERSS